MLGPIQELYYTYVINVVRYTQATLPLRRFISGYVWGILMKQCN